VSNKSRKPFDGIGRPSNDLDRIYGSDTDAKRKAQQVLGRKGIPADYMFQYIAETDMRAYANKYLKNRRGQRKQRGNKRGKD